MKLTQSEERMISLLFLCANASQSKTRRSILVKDYAETFDTARKNGWISPTHCDEFAGKTPHTITIKGRDELRRLNDLSTRTNHY